MFRPGVPPNIGQSVRFGSGGAGRPDDVREAGGATRAHEVPRVKRARDGPWTHPW